MTQYEVVARLTCDLDSHTPEEAAVAFRAALSGCTVPAIDLHDLAVWWLPQDGSSSALTMNTRKQLTEFFRSVARDVIAADQTFREEVAAILAGDPGASESGARPERSHMAETTADSWESDGGHVSR